LLAAATVPSDVDIEALDANILFYQAIAERWQMIEQHATRGLRLGLKHCGQHAVFHHELQPHRSKLRWAESQLQRTAAFLGGVEGPGHASDKSRCIDARQIVSLGRGVAPKSMATRVLQLREWVEQCV
jgi:hypothetical protein